MRPSSSPVSDLVHPWHQELAANVSALPEFVATLERRLAVIPWRHPESPVPVRPVLLPSATAAAIGVAGRQVVRLAVEECARRAAEPAALAELLGIPVTPLLTDRPSWNRWSASQARPDLVLSGGVPKVLECNIGAAIGGLEDTLRLDQVFTSIPPSVAPTTRWRVRPGRSVPARRELLVRIAQSRGVSTPRIGIAGASAAHFAEVVDEAARHGIECVFVELDDLTEDGGLQDASGRRFDVFLQKFIAAGAYRDGEPMGALEAAVRNDSTFVASPDLASLQSSKKVLAWLTESADDLPVADRETVRRHVPWTAELRDVTVERDGRRQGLLDLLEREQRGFVLKPTDMFGGHGIVVGREVDSDVWREALEASLGQSYIAQEYWAADPLPTSAWDPVAEELALLDLPHVLSPFLIDGRVEGFFARFSRPGQGAVTSADSGGCNTVLVHD